MRRERGVVGGWIAYKKFEDEVGAEVAKELIRCKCVQLRRIKGSPEETTLKYPHDQQVCYIEEQFKDMLETTDTTQEITEGEAPGLAEVMDGFFDDASVMGAYLVDDDDDGTTGVLADLADIKKEKLPHVPKSTASTEEVKIARRIQTPTGRKPTSTV